MIKNNISIANDDRFFSSRITEEGYFEPDKLEAAFKYVNKPQIALDIGGHYGTSALWLANKFDTVFSFEGNPNTYEHLLETVALSKFNNISTIYRALGNKEDSVDIGFSKKSKKQNYGECTVLGNGNTPMSKLDSFDFVGCKPCNNGVRFIKIDVEGYELNVLKGAEKTIIIHQPIIMFEENKRCLEHGVEYGDCGRFLETLDYEFKEKIKADLIYAPIG